jgi:hypothetical protein
MKKMILILVLSLMLIGCKQEANQAVAKLAEVVASQSIPDDKELTKHLGSDNCLKEYKDYFVYNPIKAFATSTDGSCGWSGETMESIDAAKKMALEYCEQFREDGEPCKVVELDGKWQ